MKNFCKNIRVTFSKYSMCNLIFLNLVTRKWKSKTLPYQFAFAQTVFKHLKYYNKTICSVNIVITSVFFEVWNSWVTISSCKIEWWKTTSHFKKVTRNFLQKLFIWVTNLNLQYITFYFELLTWRLNFYFHFQITYSMLKDIKFHFELLEVEK